ncbi:MAG: hypothetical protein PHX13_11685 [Thiovulaceae bacterium]|nr:hypothetical protein [Sulfurimonadaceae bacterium]
MNILLLNDNPVVTKLVTLSAQKTGSEILIVNNVEEILGGSYDLLIVDEALYSSSLMDELKSKISYKRSLYMLSRGSQSIDEFDHEVKKPFLPTDLVELLSLISAAVLKMKDEPVAPAHVELEEDLDLNKDLDHEVLTDSDIDDGFNLDDFDLNLDDIDLDNLDLADDEIGSILDQDEVQEVKNLLDEAESEKEEDELNLDNELGLDNFEFEDYEPLSMSDKVNLEDFNDVKEEDSLHEDVLEDDLSFDDLDMLTDLESIKPAEMPIQEKIEEEGDEFLFEDELNLDEPTEPEAIPMDDKVILADDEFDVIEDDEFNLNTLEEEIENALGTLSQDDLDQEIDLSFDDLDEFATLDEKSLKIALGEEVEDTIEDGIPHNEKNELLDEAERCLGEESVPHVKEESSELSVNTTDGVEALKTLLKALSNEDVVASLKGMNISINISFGSSNDK